MICKIADYCVKIIPRSRAMRLMCAPYACESGIPELCIETTDEDIAQEKVRDNNLQSGMASYEEIAVYRKICAYALAHDAFLMHCAVIEYEGRGYAFAAQSGTGKTTHIRLWQQLFGADKVTIVNGDKPLLRLIDGVFYAYGTPWCGKEGYNTNTRVPLSGLCFIECGTQNSIRRMSDEEAIPHLFSQIMVTDSTDLAKQMELADSLLCKMPCYLLTCNMEIDAARVAYDGMCADGVKGSQNETDR